MNNFPRVTIRLLMQINTICKLEIIFQQCYIIRKQKNCFFSSDTFREVYTQLLCICCVKTLQRLAQFCSVTFHVLTHVWMNEEVLSFSSSPSLHPFLFSFCQEFFRFLDTLAKQNSLYPHGVRLLDKHYLSPSTLICPFCKNCLGILIYYVK